ncbi:MAG: shikimate kinase [Bacteroidetes bacterium]|nr:shikimate kinase [Bacteroidota bacterium]
MRIYLVGFMGSGKTKNGKILAAKTGMQFIDLDDLITQLENKSIAEIFAANGEDYFRTLETQILLSTQSFENAIISCGGGTPCFNNNMQWILENGNCIYLTAPIEILFGRLKEKQSKRPLLKNFTDDELRQYIESKIEERKPFYNMAPAIVDTSHSDKEKQLLKLVKRWKNDQLK